MYLLICIHVCMCSFICIHVHACQDKCPTLFGTMSFCCSPLPTAMCQCTQVGTAHTETHNTAIKRPHIKLNPELQTSDSPAAVCRVQLIKEKSYLDALFWRPLTPLIMIPHAQRECSLYVLNSNHG